MRSCAQFDRALTPEARPGGNQSLRKTATLLATLFVAGANPVYADDTSVVTCALEQAGLARPPDWLRRFDRASFVPRVALGLGTAERMAPGLAARSIEVFGWLAWPLAGRVPHGVTAELSSLAGRRAALAETAAARQRRVATLHRAPAVHDLREEIDAAIDLDEADAELAAVNDGRRVCP